MLYVYEWKKIRRNIENEKVSLFCPKCKEIVKPVIKPPPDSGLVACRRPGQALWKSTDWRRRRSVGRNGSRLVCAGIGRSLMGGGGGGDRVVVGSWGGERLGLWLG